MRRQIVPAVVAVVLFTLVTLAYSVGTTLADLAPFHDKADGSLVEDADGKVVGSKLIGQTFAGEEYFQSPALGRRLRRWARLQLRVQLRPDQPGAARRRGRPRDDRRRRVDDQRRRRPHPCLPDRERPVRGGPRARRRCHGLGQPPRPAHLRGQRQAAGRPGRRRPQPPGHGGVAGSLAWGIVADGFRPDHWDDAGPAICLLGVAVIMFAPRPA